MCEQVREDAIARALENEDVVQEIFKYLPTSDLLSCSRTNQLWRQEAHSFVRDHRKCTVKLGYDDGKLWTRFLQLEQVLENMKVIPFNSLHILVSEDNFKCRKKADVRSLTNLMTKFPLKFLSILEFGQQQLQLNELSIRSKPAASTIFELIRRNSSVLLELEIRARVWNTGLFYDWEPPQRFDKLKKLSVAQDSSISPECAKKIILRAPNLKGIHENCLYMIRDNVIPENMYGTLKLLVFALEDIDLLEKFADKMDRLEELILDQSGGWLGREWRAESKNLSRDEDANKRRFVPICQKVLALNATLRKIDISFKDYSLYSQLEFPTLPSVENLKLSVNKIAEALVHIVSINFRGSFPNLRQVHISGDYSLYSDENNGNMILDEDITAVPNASQTTLELTIGSEIRIPDLVTLRRIFPNVTKFSSDGRCCEPLGLISQLWPNLQSLSIKTRSIGDEEFYAQVFGLHPEELKLLVRQDKEFLKHVQVPPCRPCVATLKELKHFQVEYVRCNTDIVGRFLHLAEALLLGRSSDLNFKMESESGSSLEELWEDLYYQDLLGSDSDY